MTVEDKKDLVGTAAQIVYEYKDWGCEHVSDMYDCIESPNYSFDDLEDMCYKVDKLKLGGMGYARAVKTLL